MEVEYRVTGTAVRAIISFVGREGRTVTVIRALPWLHTFEADAVQVLSIGVSSATGTGTIRVGVYLNGRRHMMRERANGGALVQLTGVLPGGDGANGHAEPVFLAGLGSLGGLA